MPDKYRIASYGAEHELIDWDVTTAMPSWLSWNRHDYTIVNSNGIANDPDGRWWPYGGEVNTEPTNTVEAQSYMLRKIPTLLLGADVNYRSNLHLHFHIPGLKEDLAMLKRIQRNIHECMPIVFEMCLPLPLPAPNEDEKLHKLNRLRFRRNKVSHRTLLPAKRLRDQMAADTVQEFFAAEPPRGKKGQALWHFQPRVCVNLRQLNETDTIEFRCFGGTMDPEQLFDAFQFCSGLLHNFMRTDNAISLTTNFCEGVAASKTINLPLVRPCDPELERGYQMTKHDGSIAKREIQKNIGFILGKGGIRECFG